MFFVYAISSLERNYINVGLTDTIERRIFEHNSGKNNTRKSYRPFALIYSEECATRIEARARKKNFLSQVQEKKIDSKSRLHWIFV